MAAADLSSVIIYPNPYRADFNTRKEVTFIRLPRQAVIRLYTIAGGKVAELRKDDPGNRLSWNLTNERGRPVASGVYLYIITAGSEERRGKLVIQR